jgi:subtilisin family serine protease
LVILVMALAGPPYVHAQSGQPQAAAAATISTYLQSKLAASEGPVSFLVIMSEQTDAPAWLQTQNVAAAARAIKAQALYTHLTAVAQRTQAPVRSWLDANQVPYRAYYLVNMIEVEGDAATAAALAGLPGVARLVGNPAVGQQLAVETPDSTWLKRLRAGPTQQSPAIPFGLEYTNATEVWALGYRGQGIVVASQDTGVEWDHPALMTRYRGVVSDTVTMTYTVSHAYNWFDAEAQATRPSRCDPDPQTPCDDHGHGTHTVGTMLGNASPSNTVLGMAPDAQWIGCRNMDHGVGTPASYTACFQFFLAPFPQNGDPMTDGKPELGPDVINNSWGCPPAEGCDADSLRQVVETVRAAGQMVVASAGNSGSSCSSVRDPIAIYDAVFSVGAHDAAGNIAAFSSRGPVTVDGSQRLKPDLAAPGVSVYSATVNRSYSTLSGTSMASPHVAGAVALLWSAVPALTGQVDLTEQVLIKSATPVSSTLCNETAASLTPNNVYGYGRLNVLAAVELAQQPVTLTVQVLDQTDAPVAGIAITATDQLTGYPYTGVTDDTGSVTLPLLLAGGYRLTTAAGEEYATLDIALEKGSARQVELRPQSNPPAIEWYIPYVTNG